MDTELIQSGINMSEARFSGIVIGFEQLPGFEDALIYAYGSVNNNETYFYVKVEKDVLEKYMKYGIGQQIDGAGEIISSDPLVIVKKT